MIGAILSALSPVATSLIDNLFETEEEKAAARAKLMKAESDGKLKEIEVHMSAILAEAKANDPWTSRARPTFLYVLYVMIVSSIPMGFLFAFQPETAQAVTLGMRDWLAAIPEPMWALFGAGYLGYSAARSWDKAKAPRMQ